MRFFFNNSLRSYDISVGKLFNDLWVIHYDKNKPNDIQEIKVPLLWQPKLHWYLRKFDTIPDTFNIKTVLPRITFSRSAPQYDSKRQLNKYTRIKGNKRYSADVENYIQQYAGAGVPYKIPYEFNIWAVNMIELNQILEQILSFFKTQTYNIFVNEVPLFDVGRNCKLTIDNTSSNYNSEFDIKGDRVLRHKFTLNLEGSIYPIIKEDYVIKEINAYYWDNEEDQNAALALVTNGTCECDDEGNEINITARGDAATSVISIFEDGNTCERVNAQYLHFIEQWLRKYNLFDIAVINKNYTVDIHGDVDISNQRITEIPIQFRNIRGSLNIAGNRLTTLCGCPTYVGGDFDCSFNALTTLKYTPYYVGGNYDCHGNSDIDSYDILNDVVIGGHLIDGRPG